MTNREIAFTLLKNSCGKCLANKSLYPNDIFQISYDYLFNGCKCRADYEYIVNFFIEQPDFRKELLS